MHTVSYSIPGDSRSAAHTPARDGALVAEIGELLRASVRSLPSSTLASPSLRAQALVAPMGRLCATARRKELPIEMLIVALKQSWATLPEVRAYIGDGHSEVLTTAITVCIEEYYRR